MKLKHYLQGFTTLALLLMFLTSSVFAQFGDVPGIEDDGFGPPESHVEWTVELAQKEVKPGSYVLVKGVAKIDEHWHIYSVIKQSAQPLEIQINETDGLEKASELFSTPGKKIVDDYDPPNPPMTTYELSEKAEMGIWFKVPENFTKSEAKLSFLLTWQVCGDMCVEGEQKVELTLKISETGEFIDKITYPENIAFATGIYVPVKDVPENESKDESDSLIWFLVVAALGGLASILTPCVFPMIPITISYFVKLSEQKDTKPVVLSITYIIGIVFTLTFFGLVLALILGAIDIGNQIAGLPWVNLVIALILVIFTLSFFGLFELTLPSGIINRLNKIGRNPQTGAVISTFVLGVVFTMTSFACTGPIMGTIVGAAVTTGEYFRAFTGMLVYSIFFALPFFFLALSPGLIKKLPRSGIWMVKMKVFMGFIIFLFVWYFVVNIEAVWGWGIFTRPVVVGIWAATFFLMGLYSIGKFHFKEEGPSDNKGVGALGGFFAIFFFGLAIYFAGSSITGRPVWSFVNTFFPTDNTAVSYSANPEIANTQVAPIDWNYDYEKGIQQAIDENKPAFLYFTTHTCHNCKMNESNVFVKPEIRERFKNFVLIKMYNDFGEHATNEEKDKNRAISKKYADQKYIMFGVYPTYLIVDPKTEKPMLGKESYIDSLLDLNKFAEFLDKHIQK